MDLYRLFGAAQDSYYSAQAANQAQAASSRATDAITRARDLQQKVDQLVLACMAMWSLLKDKTGLTEQELIQKIQEIDLSDGRLDGKVRVNVATCPSCGRAMSRTHGRCLFCGKVNEGAEGFDAVK